jgi:uncharacterized protein (TIGR00288 family)
LTPWWMRPTAEGLSEEEKREPQSREKEAREQQEKAGGEAAAEPPEAEPAAEAAAPPEPVAPPPAPVFEEPAAPEPREEKPSPFVEPERPEEAAVAEGPEEKEEGEEGEPRAETAEGPEEARAEARRKRRRPRSRRRPGRAGDEAGEDLEGEEEAAEEAPQPEKIAAKTPEPKPEPKPEPRAKPERKPDRKPERKPEPKPERKPEPKPEPKAAMPAVPVLVPASGRPARESYGISPAELEPLSREIIITMPDRPRGASDERKIAMFCDLENVALGVRDSEVAKFDIGLVLERLLEKGKIIVKKAYADWERYSEYKRPFHEAAIELIDIPQKYYSGKNSADIKMVVDAMDLSYSKEHLDTFVILSGDSDFSPLVSKLKENNKYVIGIGVKNSSSNLLVDNCDEFIYYEDVWRDFQKPPTPKLEGVNRKTAEAFELMIESIQALVRENKDVLWGSMIKQTMQRKKPSFNEGYYGYSTFSELLEDAERKNLIKLKKDQRSGTYIVTGFVKSAEGAGRK